MTGDQRVVMSARIIGAVRREAPKLKMFMICVSWSDAAEVIIYRSFQDFKEFHRQLKKRFPHMNPFRKDRVLPKFHGKARRSSLQQKGSSRYVQRMKFLESYCDKLLKCDQAVTQSSEVTRFFIPKDQDLQADFTKNSVMILLSDDLPDGHGGGGADAARPHAGSVTHPFVTQTYRCVAAYETKDTKNRPFKVAVDEILDVLIKEPAGWWLVENEDKCLAWFPAPYLEILDEEEGDDAEFQLGGALYCAVRSFSANKDDEVSVAIGSVVDVLRKSDNGWWLIRVNGKAGYVPSMYLQPYNNPRAGLFSLQRKLHSSTLNLATTSEPQASHSLGVKKQTSLEENSSGPYRGDPSVPGRFRRAQSLDLLSETWLQAPTERDASTSASRSRIMRNASTESDFSALSSSSESSNSLSESSVGSPVTSHSGDSGQGSFDLSPSGVRSGSISSESSLPSVSSEGSQGAPKVPPRPKTEEILTRCTTMTRKAALATEAQLRIQPEHGIAKNYR